MRLSELLFEAVSNDDLLVEGLEDDEDVSKSLNSLIKYNDGAWKSQKQAKYFLTYFRKKSKMFYHHKPMMSWARKEGFGKDVILVPTIFYINDWNIQKIFDHIFLY